MDDMNNVVKILVDVLKGSDSEKFLRLLYSEEVDSLLKMSTVALNLSRERLRRERNESRWAKNRNAAKAAARAAYGRRCYYGE